MARFAISQPVPQVEAPRLLTGKGRYTDDVTLGRQSYAVFLRSPHPLCGSNAPTTSRSGTRWAIAPRRMRRSPRRRA